MAIGIYFSPAAFPADKYDECMRLLTKAGGQHPAGRSYHAAFGPPDKLMVFDIWTSQAAFEAFGKTLMPILQQIGVDPGKPEIMPVHNVVVPPAGAATAAGRAAQTSAKGGAKAAPIAVKTGAKAQPEARGVSRASSGGGSGNGGRGATKIQKGGSNKTVARGAGTTAAAGASKTAGRGSGKRR